jgi:hypothetical protein
LILENNKFQKGKTQMANIVISELRPAGSELFMDSESYLTDLNDTDAIGVIGGLSGNQIEVQSPNGSCVSTAYTCCAAVRQLLA